MISFSRPSRWHYLEGSCQEVGHTWSSSCVYSYLEMGAFLMREGVKIYLPLRLIADIARGTLIKNLMNGSLLKDVLRSSVFLGANGGFLLFWICCVRYVLKRFYKYTFGFVPGFLASVCAILVEKKSRRGLLAGYTCTVAIEFLSSLFKHRGVTAPVPYGDVLLFSGASSYIFYYFKTHKGSRDIMSSLLRVLMSPSLPRFLVRKLRFSVLDNRLMRILLVGAWSFLLGYVIQSVLSLISQFSKLRNLKEAIGRIYQVVFNQRNALFGAFLGSFSAGFLAANSILWYLPLPRSVRLLLAGFLAGLAALFYRSNSISLYIAGKSLELLFFEGVRLGYYKSWYYGDVLIYALSTATIYHAAFLHGYLLRPAYWNFLISGTNYRITQVNYDQLDHFGTHSSRKPREERIKIYQKAVAAGKSGIGKYRNWEPVEVRELQARHGQLRSEPEVGEREGLMQEEETGCRERGAGLKCNELTGKLSAEH